MKKPPTLPKIYDNSEYVYTENYIPNYEYDDNPLGIDSVDDWQDLRAKQVLRKVTNPTTVRINTKDKQWTGIAIGLNAVLTVNNDEFKSIKPVDIILTAINCWDGKHFEIKVLEIHTLESDKRLCIFITEPFAEKTGWFGLFAAKTTAKARHLSKSSYGGKQQFKLSGYPEKVKPFPYFAKVTEKNPNDTFKVEPIFAYTNTKHFEGPKHVGLNSANIEAGIYTEPIKPDQIKLGDYVALDLKTGDIFARVKHKHKIDRLGSETMYQNPWDRNETKEKNTDLYFQMVDFEVASGDKDDNETPAFYHNGTNSKGNEGSPLFGFVWGLVGHLAIGLHFEPRYEEKNVIVEPEEGSAERPKEQLVKSLIGGVAVRFTPEVVKEVGNILKAKVDAK